MTATESAVLAAWHVDADEAERLAGDWSLDAAVRGVYADRFCELTSMRVGVR